MSQTRTIYYIVLIVAFLIGGFFVVTYATGYTVDIRSRNIKSTGMMVIQTDNADIEVNSQTVGHDDVTLRGLEPGQYQIKISKAGYHDWFKTVELDAGEAEIISDAILFYTDITPKEYPLTDDEFFSKMADTDALTAINGEIHQNGNFVTRLANEIKGVCWYSDRRYIAYSYDKKLKIIQIDGTNEIELLDKDSDKPVVFLNSGRFVIYQHEGKTYKAEIR